jgi:hypothetical protein
MRRFGRDCIPLVKESGAEFVFQDLRCPKLAYCLRKHEVVCRWGSYSILTEDLHAILSPVFDTYDGYYFIDYKKCPSVLATISFVAHDPDSASRYINAVRQTLEVYSFMQGMVVPKYRVGTAGDRIWIAINFIAGL